MHCPCAKSACLCIRFSSAFLSTRARCTPFSCGEIMNENHYEVLGIERSATKAEIKSAYLQLSKKYHPDVNASDPDLHMKFVRVREAYTILSKSSTRTHYDCMLNASHSSQFYNWTDTEAPREAHFWRDESIYTMRNRSDDARYQNRGYYGDIKWLPKHKVSNMAIVTGSVGLLILGTIVHVIAANFLGGKQRKQLDEKDRRISAAYREVRNEATTNSAEEQIRKVWERMQNGNGDD